jgi:hypothetical protein
VAQRAGAAYTTIGAKEITMAKTRSKPTIRIPLRAVTYRHDRWWIAHCLELDLVAEGKTPREAIKDLVELACTQIEAAIDEGDLESVFRPAPAEIWATFSKAADTRITQRPPCPVDRFEVREAALT